MCWIASCFPSAAHSAQAAKTHEEKWRRAVQLSLPMFLQERHPKQPRGGRTANTCTCAGSSEEKTWDSLDFDYAVSILQTYVAET